MKEGSEYRQSLRGGERVMKTVFKERKCAYRKCDVKFVPHTYYQKYHSEKCRSLENNSILLKYIKLGRKAQKEAELKEQGTA